MNIFELFFAAIKTVPVWAWIVVIILALIPAAAQFFKKSAKLVGIVDLICLLSNLFYTKQPRRDKARQRWRSDL